MPFLSLLISYCLHEKSGVLLHHPQGLQVYHLPVLNQSMGTENKGDLEMTDK